MFPKTPSITCHDPLADLLGAGSEPFTYTFEDAVKLAGHACPTVAGAFLLAKKAMELLYPDTMPQRGDVAILVPGSMDEGVTGPITQIFTLITGAAATNGFKGLGGYFNRMNLMRFEKAWDTSEPFLFKRLSNQQEVCLSYSPHHFPPSPKIGMLLPLILSNRATPAQTEEFGSIWRHRVLDILADDGEHTIFQHTPNQ
ncbi:MAG: hypothetical protein H7839_10380 [Magnetococcus sp. YQC-5]